MLKFQISGSGISTTSIALPQVDGQILQLEVPELTSAVAAFGNSRVSPKLCLTQEIVFDISHVIWKLSLLK